MGNSGERPSTLNIIRHLEGGKVVVRTACKGGILNVLNDAEGGHLSVYEAALRGKTSASDASVEIDGAALNAQEVFSVGFDERFKDGQNAAQFLAEQGFASKEVQDKIDLFDLSSKNYLYCSQLSETAGRQLRLEAALKSQQKVLLLRDPFQPFSGRWREHFAKLLIEDVTKKNRVIICTSVSFVPKLWTTHGSIETVDVGHLAQEAIQQARWEAEQREKSAREREREAKALEKQEAEKLSPSTTEDKSPSIKVEIPDSIATSFNATRDFIFEPLADISAFVRKYFLLGGTLGTAAIVALLFTMMFPNLAAMRDKLGSMQFSYSWKEIVNSFNSTPESSKKISFAPSPERQQAAQPNEESIEEISDESTLNPGEGHDVLEEIVDAPLMLEPPAPVDPRLLEYVFEILKIPGLELGALALSQCSLKGGAPGGWSYATPIEPPR